MALFPAIEITGGPGMWVANMGRYVLVDDAKEELRERAERLRAEDAAAIRAAIKEAIADHEAAAHAERCWYNV